MRLATLCTGLGAVELSRWRGGLWGGLTQQREGEAVADKCPYCESEIRDVYTTWTLHDYSTEFRTGCSTCEKEFEVDVEYTPNFTLHKLRCQKCGVLGIEQDHRYCQKCKAEIHEHMRRSGDNAGAVRVEPPR